MDFRIKLCDERDGDDWFCLDASYDGKKLEFSGDDFGGQVGSFFGGEEYEYWYQLDEANTKKFIAALKEDTGIEDLKEALKTRFSGINASGKIREFAEARDIKMGFYSHVS